MPNRGQSATTIAAVFKASTHYLSRRDIGASEFEWVRELATDGIQQMIQELASTFEQAESGKAAWSEFDAVLHEWEESALARRSPELAAAFAAAPEEVPLGAPPPVPDGE